MHLDSDELALVKIPILNTLILNTEKRKDFFLVRVGSTQEARGNGVGVGREQKACLFFSIYFGGSLRG